jgi:hypothetical protein
MKPGVSQPFLPATTQVMSDKAWGRLVADEMGLATEEEIERVTGLLIEAGIRAGRPRNPHTIRIKSVYFAGIKRLRPIKMGEEDLEMIGQHRRAPDDAQSPDADDVVFERKPFAFAHNLAPGFTAFATDRVNDAGKSTILGVILWALRGSPPEPTLQSDIRTRWLREAAVMFEIDGTPYLNYWRVLDGEPEGEIYLLSSSQDIDLLQLRVDALAAADWSVDGDEDVEASAERAIEGAEKPFSKADSEVAWPGTAACSSLLASGAASVMASFRNGDEFEEAVSGIMLSRLDLEPVTLWAKNAKAYDSSDGSVVEHGWRSLSNALTIIDPTTKSVLGEHTMLTQHLLGVFLGSRWSHTTVTARRHMKKVDAVLTSVRRRRDADLAGNASDLQQMKDELVDLRSRLEGLGDVPGYALVQKAAARANADTIAASLAHTQMLRAAGQYGEAERALAAAEQDLHALTEAAATKRFFHSLRPSCCPRCDSVIENVKWARESEGHCSLCDSEFTEVISVEVLSPITGHETGDDGTLESGDSAAVQAQSDEDDVVLAVRIQVSELAALVGELSEAHDMAREEHRRLSDLAGVSAAELQALDRSASEDRYLVENQAFRLEGRIAEREGLNEVEIVPELGSHEFASGVFHAAEKLAKAERDKEQRRTVEIVSEVLTKLGIEFGIRNLVKATLISNGQLPVIKGGGPENFSGLNPGERLRLKIALIVGLLYAGKQTGTGRHPGVVIIDDLTTHEINPDDAAKMAARLSTTEGLQVITASTLGLTLRDVVGEDGVVMPPEGEIVLF